MRNYIYCNEKGEHAKLGETLKGDGFACSPSTEVNICDDDFIFQNRSFSFL